MKNKHFFLMLSIPFAMSFWIFDSSIHYFVFGEFEFELIPDALNELWMRGTILILLIVFGIFADYHTNQLVRKESEKFALYAAMLDATKHILRNFLNKMGRFRLAASKSQDFDKEILKLYDDVINDAVRQIKNLEEIKNPSKESIEERYKPK